MIDPLDRRTFEAATLMRDHPPRWTHPNKRAVFEVAFPAGSVHQGTIGYSRWLAEPLPDRMLAGRDSITAKAGYFDRPRPGSRPTARGPPQPPQDRLIAAPSAVRLRAMLALVNHRTRGGA